MDYNVWLTASDSYYDSEDDTWKSTFNEFDTTLNVAKFVRAVGNCEKEYRDERLEIRKQFGTVTLEGNVTRELVCTKRVVETIVHPPEMTEGWTEEKVEWDCHTPSLLGLVKEVA
jgi:hypothetical protein